MPSFSKKSKEKLETCIPQLQQLFNEVIKERDCIIICGARSLEDQQKAFKGGFSKTDGVIKKSNHQVDKENPLSRAVDVLPYPIKWNDTKGHKEFADYVFKIAHKLEINIQWGGLWKTFKDYPHWEINI